MSETNIFYSAHEEEKIINKYLDKNPDIDIGTYIDIGAGDPTEGNNTYYYYLRGWSGILVEPYPTLITRIPNARPNDIFEPIAISNHDGTVEMCDSAAVPSFLGQIYKRDWPTKSRKVPCLTIDSLIKKYPQYSNPDFVSIDVETYEDKVLSTTNFIIFTPKIIIIEYRVRGCDYRKNWEHYLLPYYEFKEIIGANAVYTRKKDVVK